MSENPFLSMAGDMSDKKKGKKGEAIAKSPFWESLGENFEGFSGDPTYWKYRKKYLKALAEKHDMWLVRQFGDYILVWKDKKGNVDAYTSKNMWDVVHKMKEKAKLRWLL